MSHSTRHPVTRSQVDSPLAHVPTIPALSHIFPTMVTTAPTGTRSRSGVRHQSQVSFAIHGLAPPVASRAEAAPVASGTSASARSRKRRSSQQPFPPQALASALPKRKRSRTANRKPPPVASTVEEKKPSAKATCCICMNDDVSRDDLAGLNGCEHQFCFECISQWAERENTCPLCKCRFVKIDRLNKKRVKGRKNSKKVRQRDQRSDLLPGALEGLMANIGSNTGGAPSIARLIFSGFQDLGQPVRLAHFGDPVSFFEDGLGRDGGALALLFRAMEQGGRREARPLFARREFPVPPNNSAGNRAENPLEIDDSDEDDAVEVVQVVRR